MMKLRNLLFSKKFMKTIAVLGILPYFRKKFLNKVMPFINNEVSLINEKGEKKRLSFFNKVNGLKLELTGMGNQILLYQPTQFKKIVIKLGGQKNKIVIEQSDHPMSFQVNMGKDRTGRLLHIKKGLSMRSGKFVFNRDHAKKIIVGQDCLFSDNIVIRTTDSHLIYDAKTNKQINGDEDVIIGDHVWLGKDVTILKGSIVPPNSVVGMGSIFTRGSEKNPDMEQTEGKVYVGSPAKCVREHIIWKG